MSKSSAFFTSSLKRNSLPKVISSFTLNPKESFYLRHPSRYKFFKRPSTRFRFCFPFVRSPSNQGLVLNNCIFTTSPLPFAPQDQRESSIDVSWFFLFGRIIFGFNTNSFLYFRPIFLNSIVLTIAFFFGKAFLKIAFPPRFLLFLPSCSLLGTFPSPWAKLPLGNGLLPAQPSAYHGGRVFCPWCFPTKI